MYIEMHFSDISGNGRHLKFLDITSDVVAARDKLDLLIVANNNFRCRNIYIIVSMI